MNARRKAILLRNGGADSVIPGPVPPAVKEEKPAAKKTTTRKKTRK
jgi:hypothetical protein